MTTAFGVLPALFAVKKGSQGSSLLPILLIIGVAFYFLFYRPQQQKAKRQRQVSNQFDVGDEVLTAGGIVGHVIDIEDDRVTLETSVGASFVVLRQYVVRRLEPANDAEHYDVDGRYDDGADGDGYDDDDGADGADGDGYDDDDDDDDGADGDDPAADPGDEHDGAGTGEGATGGADLRRDEDSDPGSGTDDSGGDLGDHRSGDPR